MCVHSSGLKRVEAGAERDFLPFLETSSWINRDKSVQSALNRFLNSSYFYPSLIGSLFRVVN